MKKPYRKPVVKSQHWLDWVLSNLYDVSAPVVARFKFLESLVTMVAAPVS